MNLLVQDRGSSDRSSQSLLPLHQRSMGRQNDPGWFLLPQRNSEMSQVPLEEKDEASAGVNDTMTDISHVAMPSVVHQTFISSASVTEIEAHVVI